MPADIEYFRHEHDHPLQLVYRGEQAVLDGLIHLLRDTFGAERTHAMPSIPAGQPLMEVLGALMPIHAASREDEYFAHCVLEDEAAEGRPGAIYVAFNHRFNDIGSIGRILAGCPFEPRCVPTGAKICPPPSSKEASSPSAPAGSRLSCVLLSAENLAILKARYVATRVEVAFLVAAAAISWQAAGRGSSTQQMMCLHNVRKSLGKNGVAGGDYSCMAKPFLVPIGSESCWAPGSTLAHNLTRYFQELRGNLLLTEDQHGPGSGKSHDWMFDSWIGAGVGQFRLTESSCCARLDIETLMGFFSAFTKDFVLAVDVGEEVKIFLFADDVEISDTVVGKLMNM